MITINIRGGNDFGKSLHILRQRTHKWRKVFMQGNCFIELFFVRTPNRESKIEREEEREGENISQDHRATQKFQGVLFSSHNLTRI
jgi:hypothetical protein